MSESKESPSVEISRLGKSSMDFQQAITRDGEIISTAKVTVVFVNKEGKPTAIPEIIRQNASAS